MVRDIDGASPPGQSPGIDRTAGERDSPGGGGSGGGGAGAGGGEDEQSRRNELKDRVELGSGLSGAFDYAEIARLTEMVERMLGDSDTGEEERREPEGEEPEREHNLDRTV